jgi:hypothetical protein
MIVQVNPVIDYSVRGLCKTPYYNHPKGCPNFNYKEGCPPTAPFFDKVFDLNQPIYAIINEFDIGTHIETMKNKHPKWLEHQCRCVLYWQAGARKKLKEQCVKFLKSYKGYHITTNPEGMGVNVTETLRQVGIELEWMPVKVARQVALAGIRRK